MHLAEAGAAIEAALGQRPAEPDPDHRAAAGRGRATSSGRCCRVVAGPGLAEAVSLAGRYAGAGRRPRARRWSELTAAAEHAHGDLVILPNDMETLGSRRHLAAALRRHGRRVAVIPTVAQVQGLAAMAVHEPTADFDSVVVDHEQRRRTRPARRGDRRRGRGDDHGRSVRGRRRPRAW